MSLTTLSSQQFNQDTGAAKQAALLGPVVITDCGRPAHVLITSEEYQRLTGRHSKIADLLAQLAGGAETELELKPRQDLAVAANLR